METYDKTDTATTVIPTTRVITNNGAHLLNRLRINTNASIDAKIIAKPNKSMFTSGKIQCRLYKNRTKVTIGKDGVISVSLTPDEIKKLNSWWKPPND